MPQVPQGHFQKDYRIAGNPLNTLGYPGTRHAVVCCSLLLLGADGILLGGSSHTRKRPVQPWECGSLPPNGIHACVPPHASVLDFARTTG